MISVTLGFAGTDQLPTQTTGFGVVIAVPLDAKVARLALVRAALIFLGCAAWSSPGTAKGWPKSHPAGDRLEANRAE